MEVNRLHFGFPDGPRKVGNQEHIQPPIKGSTSAFNIEGIVGIRQNKYTGDLYAKSKDALEKLFDELKKQGYQITGPFNNDGENTWESELKELDRQKPQRFTINEAWHWAPLEVTPQLYKRILRAARIIPDCSYYYQDGRPAFLGSEKEDMSTFVKHFTKLDIDAWDKMIKQAPIDGPGLIKAVAKFCHPLSRIEDGPNIGNWLVTAGKLLNGEPLTKEDEIAAIAAELDLDCGKKIKQLIEKIEKRPKEQ